MNTTTVPVYTKRMAIADVRSAANSIIEQRERQAKGWDQGRYRDDDTVRNVPINTQMHYLSEAAFRASWEFEGR